MNSKSINIIGIPFDEKSSYQRGPALGPDSIRETLHDQSSNYWTESGVNLDVDVQIKDKGNLNIQTYDDLLEQIELGYIPGEANIFLGGDHSVSYPIVKTISKHHQNFDILHIDAHTDLYDSFEGDRHSHACPFARIMEDGLCKRLIQVGIRTLTKHQREQAEKYKVEVIMMKDIETFSLLKFNRPVYMSIDLDGFDPAFAPGVSHHEPGGMNPRTLINFLLKKEFFLLAADIVELNPLRDHERMTAALAAKLLKELCAKFYANPEI